MIHMVLLRPYYLNDMCRSICEVCGMHWAPSYFATVEPTVGDMGGVECIDCCMPCAYALGYKP